MAQLITSAQNLYIAAQFLASNNLCKRCVAVPDPRTAHGTETVLQGRVSLRLAWPARPVSTWPRETTGQRSCTVDFTSLRTCVCVMVCVTVRRVQNLVRSEVKSTVRTWMRLRYQFCVCRARGDVSYVRRG